MFEVETAKSDSIGVDGKCIKSQAIGCEAHDFLPRRPTVERDIGVLQNESVEHERPTRLRLRCDVIRIFPSRCGPCWLAL